MTFQTGIVVLGRRSIAPCLFGREDKLRREQAVDARGDCLGSRGWSNEVCPRVAKRTREDGEIFRRRWFEVLRVLPVLLAFAGAQLVADLGELAMREQGETHHKRATPHSTA